MWVVRQGCKGGMYLWGWNEGDYDYRYSAGYGAQRAKPTPWWGTQGGATRYTDRVQAVREATRANGRIVRLKPAPSKVARLVETLRATPTGGDGT